MITRQDYEIQSTLLKQYKNTAENTTEVLDKLALEIEKLSMKVEALFYTTQDLKTGNDTNEG